MRLGLFEQAFRLHALDGIGVNRGKRRGEAALERCFVNACGRAKGEEREFLHLDGARRGLFLRARERAVLDGVDVGCDVLRVLVADAVEIGMRGGAETEIWLVLPVAEVMTALKAQLCKIRNLVALVAMRGERLRHEVVHGLGRRVVREVEPSHLVLTPERCALFELEAVDADVVGCERQCFVDVGLEHRERLARQAVDEVEAEVLEANSTGVADGGARLFGGVDATDAVQEGIVEGLDAEGNSVDAVVFH